MSQITRRNFFSSSAAALGAASIAARSTATPQSANVDNQLNYASIGVGSRGRALIKDAANFANCRMICDVDSRHLERAKQTLVEYCAEKTRHKMSPLLASDYQQALESSDIDFVVIATPDHWHAKIAIEAMLAGKDVYCEKPLTLTIAEGRQIVEVARKTKRVVQVGTQQRSSRLFQQAVALLRDGRIGRPKRLTCALGRGPRSESLPLVSPPSELDWNQWLGPAPWAEYRLASTLPESGYARHLPYGRAHSHFRWWYEYSGGKLTDWGAHHVDIAMWALDKSDGQIGRFKIEPLVVEHPVPFVDGMPALDDRLNTATVFQLRITFEDGVELDVRHDAQEDLGFGNGIMFQGETGRYFVNRERITGKPVERLDDNPLPDGAIESLYPGVTAEGFWHMKNFVDCVHSRQTPISDVASHHRHLTVCHAANIAGRLGRTVIYDPAVEQFVDDSQANAMLHRQPREGFATAM